ncbi:MAG: hypothetical protein GY719_11130 [bacterium]|nr:hypothetical protein [bacterium]
MTQVRKDTNKRSRADEALTGAGRKPLDPGLERRLSPVVEELIDLGIRPEEATRAFRSLYLRTSDTQSEPEPLLRIQQLLDLSLTELGRIFGASRQAVTSWLRRGVPAARKPKVLTVLNIAELLERKLKAGRLPAVFRRKAPAYGDRSMQQMVEADRHEDLLLSVRESFDWSTTA